MNKTNIIFNKNVDQGSIYKLPKSEVLENNLSNIDQKFLKKNKINLPELPEPEIVRHYTNLSSKNYHIDK